MAYPAAPDVGSAQVPTFSSRAKELVSRTWDVGAGAPGRYVILGVIALLLLVSLIATSRRRTARRQRRPARRRPARRRPARRRPARHMYGSY